MRMRVKRRIYAGCVCEQEVYTVSNRIKDLSKAEPKRPRFKTEEEREKHYMDTARRKHARYFNENFSPSSLYSTLTFDDEHEIHDFQSAKRIRDNFCRVLKYHYPDAVIFLYIGKGKSTHRLHLHMVSEGVPKSAIQEKWIHGRIRRIDELREHNFYEGVDHGQDYTGLANYLFAHWTKEQGGHRWKMTKNARKPEQEKPHEVKPIPARTPKERYTLDRPPKAPAGYMLVEKRATAYGYLYFRYVKVPPQQSSGRKKRIQDPQNSAL